MNLSKSTALASLMMLAACGAEPSQATSPDQTGAPPPAAGRKLTLTYFNIEG